jgi:tetratricopeptide (TPR) repeat protein
MAEPDLSRPEVALDHGRRALQNRQEDQAVAIVAAAAERHAGDARLWQLLGALHRGLDDLAPATAAYEKALALAPDDAGTAHMLARSRLEAGLPASAWFARAQALAPADRLVRLGAISATLAESGPPAAIAALERDLARDPAWAEGHIQLAKLRWAAGDRTGFTRSFEEALAIAPRNAVLWGQYLASLMLALRHEEVLAVVARARAAAGRHPSFDLYEATAEDDLGHRDAASRLFAGLAPANDPTVNLYRLRHLLRVRRDGEAVALAERWAATSYGAHFLPYLSIAWRLTGDERWHWLEGDERLIGVYDLGEALGPPDALAAALRTLHVTADQPLDQSVRGGTQAEFILSRIDPEIRRARTAIVAAVERHLAQLPQDPDHPVLSPPRGRPARFAGSWSVRLSGAGHHASHVHPGGWLSSAFYVVVPDPADRGAAPAGWLVLGEPPAELGLELPPIRLVEPKRGRLVLFPSTMWHGTRPFAAGERLTMAFDVAHP